MDIKFTPDCDYDTDTDSDSERLEEMALLSLPMTHNSTINYAKMRPDLRKEEA
jgi:hypothetical protein